MASTANDAALRRIMLLAFILPTLVLGFMHGPEGQIQGIYAKHAGLALPALAGALLLTRMFDAITYPLIGHWSDRSFARSGTRRAWIIAGTAISLPGMWFLMHPPQGVGIVWFGIWMAVLYLGWKIIEIPLQAWSFGLSLDYAQRARVQAWRVLATLIGAVLFFATPQLAMLFGLSSSPELDFAALGLGALIALVALPLSAWIILRYVPAGEAAPQAVGHAPTLRETIAAIRLNKPLLWLLATIAVANFLTGMANSSTYLYIDAFLGLSKQYPLLMGLSAPASLLGIPFWTWLSTCYERHRVFAVSLLATAMAYAAMALVGPGPAAFVALAVLYPIMVLCLVGVVVAFVMIADCADYGRWQTGEDHSGLYSAFITFLQKSLTGVATAAGLAIAGWLGFDAAAATQSASGAFGIRLVAVILPAAGLAIAGATIWFYPLTRARLTEIRAEFVRRAEQGSAPLDTPAA
jgi:GPH family glycoside/pentoside/hexuronide:cation symporter